MTDIKPPTPPIKSNSRVIYLTGIIDELAAKTFVERLVELECQSPGKDILIYIDSYGGAIDSFIAMHDAIKLMRCPIATVCIGKAMSAGLLLLISGTPGKRFITPNSRTMMHEIWGHSFGKLSEMDNDIQETKRLQKLIEGMILRYTKLTRKSIRDFMMQDSFFNAEQTMQLGLVDHIIDNPHKLYRIVNV